MPWMSVSSTARGNSYYYPIKRFIRFARIICVRRDAGRRRAVARQMTQIGPRRIKWFYWIIASWGFTREGPTRRIFSQPQHSRKGLSANKAGSARCITAPKRKRHRFSPKRGWLVSLFLIKLCRGVILSSHKKEAVFNESRYEQGDRPPAIGMAQITDTAEMIDTIIQ